MYVLMCFHETTLIVESNKCYIFVCVCVGVCVWMGTGARARACAWRVQAYL